MRKSLILLLIATLMLMLASCGASQPESSESDEYELETGLDDYDTEEIPSGDYVDIDGKWQGEDNGDPYYVYIEDGKMLMEFFGDSMVGEVNEADKTITFEEAGKTTIFDYDVIGGQLVLTVNPEKNPDREKSIYSYTRVEDE